MKHRDRSRHLIGRKVGFVEVVEPLDRYSKQGARYYRCKCECGEFTEISSTCLREKASWKPSCGCKRKKYYSRNNDGDASFLCLFSKYKNSAKNRKYRFGLTFDEFKSLVVRDCEYCGASPVPFNAYNGDLVRARYNNELRVRHWVKVNGIDRVNNELGYELANCEPCCTQCNRAKSTTSKDEFLSWIKRAYRKNFGE